MSATSHLRKLTVALAAAALIVVGSAAPASASWWPPGGGSTTRDTQAPSTPTDFRVVSSTSTSITFAWSPSTDNKGVRSYGISIDPFFMSNSPYGAADHPTTTATVSGLQPATSYPFRLYAWDTSGNPSGGAFLTATTANDTQVPTAPSALSVVSVDGSKVTLRWTRGTDNNPLVHDVLVNGVATPNAMSTDPPGTPTNTLIGTTVRQLEPSTTYSFAVRARDGSGNVSTASNSVTATTGALPADDTPPTTPTLLRSRSLGTSACPEEYRATWTPSTDDSGYVEYEVRINGVINDLATWTDHVGYTAVWGPNTFTIVAVDRAGNASAPSNADTTHIQWGSPCPA